MKPAKMPPRLFVTVVADNPETVGGLHEYLSEAGIVVDPSRALRGADAIPASVSAVVVFPDDYDGMQVVANVTSLRTARPRVLIVLVTSSPQRIELALALDGRTTPPLVLPKPAFGWSILDVIRAHADTASEIT